MEIWIKVLILLGGLVLIVLIINRLKKEAGKLGILAKR